MFKKGFSMIELLFVMVILASLAAIAIPSMSSGTESATLTSMRSDAKNMINAINAEIPTTEGFFGFEGFQLILESEYDTVPDEKGFLHILKSGKTISMSQGNYLENLGREGSQGTCTGPLQGFSFELRNAKLPNKSVSYNSCLSSKIQVNTITN